MAVLFNAHADRLYRGSLPVANTAYTVCMWVKPRSGSGQHEFFFESDAAGTTYCLASNNGVLGILNAGGGFVYNVTLGAAMTEDVWYFVAMTINGTTGNLYRGTESSAVTNASGTVAAQASSYRVYIGSDGSSSAYPCFADIAHVRMWDAILTESELNAERTSATAVRTSNISAEWRMVDAAGKLTDSSGQSRPLTASSTGPWADASDPSFGTTVTGTSAVTQDNATSAASGIFGPQGTSVVTQGNATSAASGDFVGAVTFNAQVGDRLSRASIPLTGTAYTFSAWVKPHSGGDAQSYITFVDQSSYWGMGLHDGVLGLVNISTLSWEVEHGAALTNDVWYFVACTVNGTTGNLYRGTETGAVTNGSGTITAQDASPSSLILCRSQGGTVNFDLARVRLWDAVLSAAEIEAERASVNPVRTSNLTASWKLDSTANKLLDSSGNGRDLSAPGAGPWEAVAGPNPQVVVSGTSAVTQGNATSAASGIHSIAGTSAVTQGNATSAATGTHSIAGTSAVTQTDATSVATGLLVPIGTSAVTQGNATSSASGEHSIGGTSAVTQTDATSSASGIHSITGTSTITQTDAISAAVGLVVPVGTSAVTQTNATSEASGVHSIAGASAVTQTDATSAAAGLLVPVGTSSVTQTDATSSTTGIAVPVGNSVVTQTNATSEASGTLAITGASAVTQINATSSAVGVVQVSGSSAVTQTNATSEASGYTVVAGISSVTQVAATSVASGGAGPTATSVLTQGNATSVASGLLVPSGTSAVTQSNATSAASGGYGTLETFTAIMASVQSDATGYMNGFVGSELPRHVLAEQIANLAIAEQPRCDVSTSSVSVVAE